MSSTPIGFYFHIPFCPHICPYCDFVKTDKFSKKDVAFYFSYLKEQLHFFLEKIHPQKSQFSYATIYFGGGTPGLFSAHYYAPLIDMIKSHFLVKETTLETNPYTNQKKRFEEYKNSGFDRLTIGAQSLCPKTLSILGRRHTPEQILHNIAWAQEAGFSQIQVDLIYGLAPGLRTLTLSAEIESLIQAGATGVSTYALTIEERTVFSQKPHLSHEGEALANYLEILDACAKQNLTQWETGNFSWKRPLHNEIYWRSYPYLGIGVGAHGLLPGNETHPYGQRYRVGQRGKTIAPGNDFIPMGDASTPEFSVQYAQARTRAQYVEETVFTLLRTKEGLSLDWLQRVVPEIYVQERLHSHPRLQRAFLEGHLLLEEGFVRVPAVEKIRGDAWALDIILALESEGAWKESGILN